MRRFLVLLLTGALTAGLCYGLQARIAGIPPLGTLLDPVDGLYRTARRAQSDAGETRLTLDALDAPVTIVRDERAVPHIFADSDRDALVALGYVTAKDRLFQLDFIPRVASGRLAEAFGESAVSSDRFLRQTGMEWGARKNLERLKEEGGIELDLIRWYGSGVNAYLDDLAPEDLPFEFRLLGYKPDRYRPIQAVRLLQYMTFDLTYSSDAASYARLRRALSPGEYQTLYPNDPVGLYAPIIPADTVSARSPDPTASIPEAVFTDALAALQERDRDLQSLRGTVAEGAIAGKGSNNWAVDGAHSATGAPLLAGDMHLSLFLPPIWYEAHLVTPSMNAYGLTIPGAPGLVEGFNRDLGWTFTNTGTDQIDHYALEIDSSQTRYRYEGEWRDLQTVVDTIHVNRSAPVLDTLVYSHFGPVRFPEDGDASAPPVAGAVAEHWVAHEPSRTLLATWQMSHASSLETFEEGLQYWDTPMQNVLYAGRDGHIAIRSTGYLPMRRSGHGRGLLDGSTDAYEWIGRVPFDELPYSRDPSRGFLTSSNQKPTGPGYSHYLNHDWSDGYRSLRLDTLLGRQETHSVADFKRYQADVDVQQRDVFVPFLRPLTGLSSKADSLRDMLERWNGAATLDRPEPLVFQTFVDTLRDLTWDEPVFDGAPDPEDAPFVRLLRSTPQSHWFDVQSTERVEDGSSLLARALEATAETMTTKYGWDPSQWRWGDHHKVVFRHMSQTRALRPLWRGPVPYPGFASTVSPARGNTATHSASQRVIVDFSTDPPSGIGVVPGGQSGNPLNPQYYDTQIPTYVNFDYFELHRPSAPDALPDSVVSSRTVLTPGS